MATITPQATPIAGGYLVSWMGLSNGDTITPWPVPGSANPHLDPPDAQSLTDRNVQAVGGTVGTVHVIGSNNITLTATQFATLHLVDGTTACSLTTSQAVAQVLEPTYYISLAPTGGASGTNVLGKFTTGARFL